MGEKFEAWKNLDIPEAMYLTRKFREITVAYDEARNDPEQPATQEELVIALITAAMGAITQLEARVLTLEGVDFIPPDWEPPAAT